MITFKLIAKIAACICVLNAMLIGLDFIHDPITLRVLLYSTLVNAGYVAAYQVFVLVRKP